MRYLILALMGVMTLAPVAGAQEPAETVEERAAIARAEHADALADWEDRWYSYLDALRAAASKVRPPAPAPEPEPAAPVAAAPADPVEERLGFRWDYLDDGGCPVASNAVSGTYDRESEVYDVHAMVRTQPSGGDCRVQATAYTVQVERRYAIRGGWEAVAKFGADRRSVAAPYAIVDSAGRILARPDGGPSDPVTLPAGSAETLGGYLGVSRTFGDLRATAAVNVVPVDWSTEPDSIAAHIAASYDLGDFLDVDASADIGRDWYGSARASWRRSVAGRIGVEVSGGYAWGLTSVDAGVPVSQTFAALPVTLQGPARDTSFFAGVGVTIGLD